ncbi:MAG: PAS domain-containing sensor histidine kinase [Cytophagales bacterium]|jgi:signal transduction histidine kinase|nr:PAS domain-containing sensor histidine kinase [Cytophagales bacterium]
MPSAQLSLLRSDYLQAKLYHIIDSSQEGMLVENENREVVLVNQRFCDIFNLPIAPDQLLGRDCNALAEESKRWFKNPDGFIARISVLLAQRTLAVGDELELLHGQVLERDYVPIFLEDKYIGHLWTYRDVTEKRQAYQKMRELNEQKDTLLSILTHDLKSPMNTLQGVLGMWESLSFEEMKSFSGQIKKSVETTVILMDNLLHWAISQRHGMKPEFRRVNLSLVVEETFRLVIHSADAKNNRLVNQVLIDTELVADVNMLRLVLRNLVTNANKFTDNGMISVSAMQAANGLTISVADTGVGMTEEQRRNLFRSGTQRSTQGTANERGTGLGLLLCRDFVSQHGGELSVSSQVGSGSVFRFTIPPIEPADWN